MTLKDVPEDSRTYAAARQAFGQEYMVPIEVAWELEQAFNKGRAMLRKVRRQLRQADRAYVKAFKEVLALRTAQGGAV